MEIWIDLLFKNPIGLMSLLAIGGTIAIIVFIVIMMIVKSRRQ